MPFMMRKDAREWFKHLSFDRDFDVYYLCLVAGLATNKQDPNQSEDNIYKLIDYFPDLYKDKMHLILGMFLAHVLKVSNVESSRSAANALICKLIDPRDITGLSAEGMKWLNNFSFGGFDRLTEWFSQPPRSLEAFLIEYKDKIDQFVITGRNE